MQRRKSSVGNFSVFELKLWTCKAPRPLTRLTIFSRAGLSHEIFRCPEAFCVDDRSHETPWSNDASSRFQRVRQTVRIMTKKQAVPPIRLEMGSDHRTPSIPRNLGNRKISGINQSYFAEQREEDRMLCFSKSCEHCLTGHLQGHKAKSEKIDVEQMGAYRDKLRIIAEYPYKRFRNRNITPQASSI